jgi:hypothetical protein
MAGLDGLIVLVIGLLVFRRRTVESGRNFRRMFTERKHEDRQLFLLGLLVILTIGALILLFRLSAGYYWG